MIKFFEITLPVRVRETQSVWRPVRIGEMSPEYKPEEEFEERQLTLHVEMQHTATAEDAVKYLAEKLEKILPLVAAGA